MVEFHLASFSPESRATTLAQLAHNIGLPQASLARTETYKPYLLAPDGQTCGLAIAHIRRSAQPFSLMAACTTNNIGLDAEIWPIGTGDAIFRNSIMAKDDTNLAETFRAKGLDSGLLLWVGKEAALKATGHVMVDPRDIAITQLKQNLASATPNKNAQAMLPQTSLAYYTFAAPQSGETVLMAIALANASLASKPIRILHSGELLNFSPLNLELA